MNLKPNLWTVLFVIAAGALFYVLSTNKSEGVAPQKTTRVENVSLSDTIPVNVAMGRIAQYATRVVTRLDLSNINSSAGVLNSGVVFFKLKSDELSQMVSLFGGQDVYAYLSVEGATLTNDTIDLIFADMDPANLQNGKFFDFSIPCPPTCPK